MACKNGSGRYRSRAGNESMNSRQAGDVYETPRQDIVKGDSVTPAIFSSLAFYLALSESISANPFIRISHKCLISRTALPAVTIAPSEMGKSS